MGRNRQIFFARSRARPHRDAVLSRAARGVMESNRFLGALCFVSRLSERQKHLQPLPVSSQQFLEPSDVVAPSYGSKKIFPTTRARAAATAARLM